MSKKRGFAVHWLFIGCSLAVIPACTSAPRSSGYPYVAERNMQSVHHWQVMAQEVIENQVAPSPSNQDFFPKARPIPESVYVDGSDNTEFGKAFRGYLITELVRRGIQSSSDPSAQTVIKWGTQLVTNSKTSSSSPGVVGAALEFVGLMLVGTSMFDPLPNLEVILTTQVESMGRIVSRETHNFYIDDSNKWNFWESKRGAADHDRPPS